MSVMGVGSAGGVNWGIPQFHDLPQQQLALFSWQTLSGLLTGYCLRHLVEPAAPAVGHITTRGLGCRTEAHVYGASAGENAGDTEQHGRKSS